MYKIRPISSTGPTKLAGLLPTAGAASLAGETPLVRHLRTSTARRKSVYRLPPRMARENNRFPRAKLARYLRYAVLARGAPSVLSP